MAFALMLHGIVETFFGMLSVRALAGIAGGVLSGAVVAYVGDYFPYERRGWANGWVMSGIAVGQIVGIPIGKVLASAFGFRWPFLMFAITMGLAALLVWWFVPQPNVERDANRLTIGRALKNYWKLLHEQYVLPAAIVYLLMFFSIGVYVIYLPTWLEDFVGISSNQIALLFLVGGIANVITGPNAGTISDKVGRKPLVLVSCIGFAVVMIGTTYLTTGVISAYILFALAMVAVALRISPLQSLMSALVPAQRRGMLMSLAISIGQIGMGIASFVAGILYTQYGYLSNTILGAVAILLMAWMVQKMLPEPKADITAETAVAEPAAARR